MCQTIKKALLLQLLISERVCVCVRESERGRERERLITKVINKRSSLDLGNDLWWLLSLLLLLWLLLSPFKCFMFGLKRVT